MSMWIPRSLTALVAAASSSVVLAGTFHGIEPLDSLATVRQRIPQANLQRIESLSGREVIYRLAAPAIEGVALIGLADGNGDDRARIRKAASGTGTSPASPAVARQAFESLQPGERDPADEALRVVWLQWIPPVRLPLSDLQSRYGTPDRCGYRAAWGVQACQWTGRGVTARLANDRTVASVHYALVRREPERTPAP